MNIIERLTDDELRALVAQFYKGALDRHPRPVTVTVGGETYHIEDISREWRSRKLEF